MYVCVSQGGDRYTQYDRCRCVSGGWSFHNHKSKPAGGMIYIHKYACIYTMHAYGPVGHARLLMQVEEVRALGAGEDLYVVDLLTCV